MKVCFITCHYPPLARTWRRYQFARFLHQGGCEVEVVAHGNISRALGTYVDDADMAGEDPRIRVHRPRAFAWHLSGEILHRLGLLPCPHLNWLGPAARTAAGIARSPGDVVLGIYPPLTNLLAAHRVARRTGARLVVDFRDEFLGLARFLQRPLAAWNERRLVEGAALISVATEAIAAHLAERYAGARNKIHLTLNGYWEEVEGELGYTPRERVRLVYAGSMSPIQGLEVLLRAVDLLERSHPRLAARIEVVLYGPDNFYCRRRLRPLMGGRVRFGGFLGARQVSAALLEADICFLSLASADYAYAVPGKLYEYIAHARPILAALPQGQARRIIEAEGFGLVADCRAPAELAARLAEMLDARKRLQFHRRALARRQRYAAAPHFLALAQRIRSLA